jgi:hypothetical protein
VTGTTERLRHLGNRTIAAPTRPDATATPAVAPLASMGSRVDTTGYLSSHSDVAAHLVFTHQMHMMNLITRIGWQTRRALADGAPEAARSLAAAAVDFVDYLLFVDEPRLPAPVKGTSGFAERFSALGPRDRQGRSLRALDLQTRILKYPCSYLIYSPAFDALPPNRRPPFMRVCPRCWPARCQGLATSACRRRSPGDSRNSARHQARLPVAFVGAGFSRPAA